jgi:hypothetical protein
LNDLIQDELRQVMKDWQAGTGVRSIPIGHSVRLNQDGTEVPHVFRQKKTHEYAFRLIDIGMHSDRGLEYDEFCMLFGVAPPELSAEEREAAQSLAWKALSRGWKRAIAGFPEEQYITIQRDADA